MADNLVLGRGKVSFAKFAPGTLVRAASERYFGNTTVFNLTSEANNLDHYSSEEGLRTKDASVTLEVNRTGTLTTDNNSSKNVADFLLADLSTLTIGSATAVAESFVDVKAGEFLQLGISTLRPAGTRKVTNVVVEKGVATLVAGTDYRVDPALARIELIAGGAVVDGDDIDVTFDQTATTVEQIISSTNGAIEGALRFISYNAKGAQRDYYMPYVKLTPNGEYALKGEDWQAMSFNIEVLKLGDLASIYCNGRPV